MTKENKRECRKCGEKFDKEDMWDLETPNYKLLFCDDCILHVEDKLEEIYLYQKESQDGKTSLY